MNADDLEQLSELLRALHGQVPDDGPQHIDIWRVRHYVHELLVDPHGR